MPATDTAKFLGERLRELRKIHGITQEDAAHAVKTDYKYWQLLEAGGKDMRLSTLERIAGVFGLKARDLFAERLPKSTFKMTNVPAPHRPRHRG